MPDLPTHLRLVYHATEPHPRDVLLNEVYAGLDLPAGDRSRPFVYLNMVQTFDGQTVLDGTAWKIGTEVDHHLFRQLRVHADAVLCGAGTLRADDVVVTTHPDLQQRRVARGQPPNPIGVVASATCRFTDDVFQKKFFRRADLDRLIVTTHRAAASDIKKVEATGVAIEVVPADPDGAVDLAALLRLLAGRAMTRILCEGGPTINTSLARADLIDEIFVTVSFRLGGDPAQPRLLAAPVTDRPLELVSEYHPTRGAVREAYFRFRYPRRDR